MFTHQDISGQSGAGTGTWGWEQGQRDKVMGEVKGQSPQPPGSRLWCLMRTIPGAETRDPGREGTYPPHPAHTQPACLSTGFLPSLARKFSPN